MQLPSRVKMVEVGPRDGLQNESTHVSTAIKVELIERLVDTGFCVVEATSFVSPKWIPQLSDHAQVVQQIKRKPGVRYPVLVPNLKGLEAAIDAGVTDIAIFAAASETFSKRNINCSITESIERYASVCARAKQSGMDIRGYISCVLGCPYEGEISPNRVAQVALQLYELGCYEVSLGDTIGVGTPRKAQRLIETVARQVPLQNLAVHFHDTYGQALANILASLEVGVAVVDSSVSGLGGCPYAKGASGNVASEDVLYMLNGLDIETGVDLVKLVATGRFISAHLGHEPMSKVNRAL